MITYRIKARPGTMYQYVYMVDHESIILGFLSRPSIRLPNVVYGRNQEPGGNEKKFQGCNFHSQKSTEAKHLAEKMNNIYRITHNSQKNNNTK